MVNAKMLGIGVAIIAIIGGLATVSLTMNNSGVDTETNERSVAVTDSVELDKNNSNYTVDEQGNKKYVISASDSPSLGD